MSKHRRVRRLWEDEEKIRIVAQTRVPGVSVSQVARRYDVNANLIFKWLRDPRFNPPPGEGASASFLPVEVVAEAPILESPVNDSRVVDAPVIESAVSGSRLEVVTPSGHRISAIGAYDPEALCRLVRGLGS